MGLWETLLGHQAVFGHQVDEHVPLAAIAGGVLQQETDQPALHGLAATEDLHKGVEEVVYPLNLEGCQNGRNGDNNMKINV